MPLHPQCPSIVIQKCRSQATEQLDPEDEQAIQVPVPDTCLNIDCPETPRAFDGWALDARSHWLQV